MQAQLTVKTAKIRFQYLDVKLTHHAPVALNVKLCLKNTDKEGMEKLSKMIYLLADTISAKERYAERLEANGPDQVVAEFLKINIDELKRIQADLLIIQAELND